MGKILNFKWKYSYSNYEKSIITGIREEINVIIVKPIATSKSNYTGYILSYWWQEEDVLDKGLIYSIKLAGL